MGETTENIILEVSLNDTDAINKSIQLTDSIELLKNQIINTKDEIKKMEKAQQTNTVEYKNTQAQLIKYNAELKASNSVLATYTNTLVQANKATIAEDGSLNQKRATLNKLNAEYANLANPTQELTNKIKSLSDELKKQESALGNDTRSVGSYKQAIREATQEAQVLERTLGASAQETVDAKQSLANLTEEYQRFNKTTQQFNPENKFNAIANSTQGITNTLSTATSGMGLFGAASDEVAGSLNTFGSGIGVIAGIPAILKEAKLGFEGLAIAENAALGPIGLIAIGFTSLIAAVVYFSSRTTELTKANLDKQIELVDDRYQHEIDLARAAGNETAEIEKKGLLSRNAVALATIEAIKKEHAEEDALRKSRGATTTTAYTEDQLEQLRASFKIIHESKQRFEVLSIEQTKKSNDDKIVAIKDQGQKELIAQQDVFDQQIQLAVSVANLRQSFFPNADDNAASQQIILDSNLAFAQLQLQAQSDTGDASYQIAVINAQRQIDLVGKTQAQIALINQIADKKIAETKQASQQKQLSIYGDILGQTSTLFKKNTAAYKITASAEAIISTYSAIAKTLAAFSNVPVPGYAIAQSILTGIAGFAAVAKINGADSGFYDGGYTGSGNPRSTSTAVGNRPYVYHMNEYVVPHQLVNHPYVAAIEAMRQSNGLGYLGGFASGGYASIPQPQYGRSIANIDYSVAAASAAQSVFNEQAMANAIISAYASMPAPIVTVEDINIGQSQVQLRESRAVS